VLEKRCDHCGRTVPSNSKVGDTCPYCGVRWGFEHGPGAQGATANPANGNPVTTTNPAPTSNSTIPSKLPWILGGIAGMGVVFLGVLAVVIVILKNRF
jgi:hypothetical protein